ncbi:AAA family ATPase [Lacticaseibacillus paracasei]|uniref:AAA family ATPase n=1 Tax=Lacticaseibacillus paracasei TaxID=1597 RepID=UPI0026E038AE|nr:AAA family ATPase [Lacticaseibacillus paracasei]MDO5966534.1 AAA family ATPase [Lacticaseibacillus paracasei]
MFYGPSGIGKTETAKILGEVLGGSLMRQQLSMFQNQASFDYLFGASHSQLNFARDLSNRESNVILLDEFDKVNPALYSAFYQLFDEGIFEDKNYQIRTNNLIIICTSNFADVTQIRETLGDAMYYHFSALVPFKHLDVDAFLKIINDVVNELWSELDDQERTLFVAKANLIEAFTRDVPYFQNFRQAKSLMRQFVYRKIVDLSLKKGSFHP